ncbi:hypothetical protein FOA52_012206 [Chlamydomonas sp. UWO 241]|nr:hypothetical protein FOA52_012206 [Chlamydomonas sp. UWO 241]
MRRQVDGSITRVASSSSGFTSAVVTRALVLWPGMVHLTLLSVRSASVLLPLATASLARLTSLTVRQVGMGAHASCSQATRRHTPGTSCIGA